MCLNKTLTIPHRCQQADGQRSGTISQQLSSRLNSTTILVDFELGCRRLIQSSFSESVSFSDEGSRGEDGFSHSYLPTDRVINIRFNRSSDCLSSEKRPSRIVCFDQATAERTIGWINSLLDTQIEGYSMDKEKEVVPPPPPPPYECRLRDS